MDRAGPNWAEPGQAGSGQFGPGRVGPGRVMGEGEVPVKEAGQSQAVAGLPRHSAAAAAARPLGAGAGGRGARPRAAAAGRTVGVARGPVRSHRQAAAG